MDKIRWGILSSATIARRRAMPFLSGGMVDNGLLYAVASHSDTYKAEIIHKFHPVEYYDDYEAVITDSNVDAIYIPLLNPEHCKWVIRALEYGKPVLCEKPLGLNLAEVDKMIEVSQKTKVPLMEAFACYHTPLFPTTRSIIESGVIGKLRSMNTYFHWNSFAVSSPRGNRVADLSLGGSAVLDLGCYGVLNVRAISGKEPQRIQAMGRVSEENVDISAFAHLDMGNDFFASIEVGVDAARKTGFTILGETGFIAFNRSSNAWGELSLEVVSLQHGKKQIRFFSKPSYALEMEQFGRCITFGEKPAFSLKNSHDNMVVMTEIIKQIRGEEYKSIDK